MSSAGNPWPNGTEVTVTIKAASGAASPWIVVRAASAEEARLAVAESVGLDSDGLTLAEMAHNASARFQAMATAGSALGATVLPSKSERKAKDEPKPEPKAEAKADEGGVKVREAIANATSRGELSTIYMNNRAVFDNDGSLMKVLEARAAEF